VAQFGDWYKHGHLHSGIGYVTPADRHAGRDIALPGARREVYKRARGRYPERCASKNRPRNRPTTVTLNPENHRVALTQSLQDDLRDNYLDSYRARRQHDHRPPPRAGQGDGTPGSHSSAFGAFQ
jgi:hypothetical protein